MADAYNTVEACLGVWADTNMVIKCKSFPSELATVGDMRVFMERLVIEQVNEMFGYGLTSDEVMSTLYPDVDMDTDLRTLEKFTVIIHPTAAARKCLRALPSMTKLQDHLDAEKKKVSTVSETARLLNKKRKEQHDSIANMLKELEVQRKKDREDAEALRKKDREDAEEQRKQDAEKAKQNAKKAEALRKKEREDNRKWVEEQNRKLRMDIKNKIKLFKQHESEREDHLKQRLESTERYISDVDGFIATGDEAALDRIKCRDLLNRAQALLAMSLGLSNDSVARCSASFQFREALGPSLAVEDRQKVLLAMLEEKKDELPSQALLLMTKPEALNLLAERFPRVQLDGDQVVGKDKDALMSLLDYVSPPAR